MELTELLHADDSLGDMNAPDYISFDGSGTSEPTLDGNDWEAEIFAEDFTRCGVALGHYLYFAGSEWGGRVEKIEHISSTGIIKLSGATWRGMLARKVIEPPEGQSHKVFENTTVGAVMAALVAPFGGLFVVGNGEDSENSAAVTEQKYRYQTVLEGLTELLEERGMRLKLTLDQTEKKVILSPETVHDRSDAIEFSGDYDMKYTATKAEAQYNHVIALGQGEQENRTVRHVWLLPDGSTTVDGSNPAIATGFDERAMVYDYSGCEDAAELVKGARKKLKENGAQNAIRIDFDPPDADLPLGDRVSLRDRVTGMNDVRTITRKILRVTAQGVTLQYEVN